MDILPPHAELAMVTVCTRSHVAFAKTMVESFRRFHSEANCFAVIVDDDAAEISIPETTLLDARTIVGEGFEYMSLKYSPTELCCSMKPYAIAYLADQGYSCIVYIDSDQLVCAPLQELLSRLKSNNLVATPHILEPYPDCQSSGPKPSVSDILSAGILNAGIFGIKITQESRRFLQVWARMVTEAGAFTQMHSEQGVFNYAISFLEDVHILKDRCYNVAYWNLHDRSIRSTFYDNPEVPERWNVDKHPLVTFHFSGFSPEIPYKLSSHDGRYSLYLMNSIARLCNFYAEQLHRNGLQECRKIRYLFSAFPSGIHIDERLRRLFKANEQWCASHISPWTVEGEKHYCGALMRPIPGTGSFLPLILESIYQERPDLQYAYPRARFHPLPLINWAYRWGFQEYGYTKLLNNYRPVIFTHSGREALLHHQCRRPEIWSSLGEPLRNDRSKFITNLISTGDIKVAESIQSGEFEIYHISEIHTIRTIFESDEELQKGFPDPFWSNSTAFGHWLEESGKSDHYLTDAAVEAFRRCSQGRSLARIFSFLSRNWDVMTHWPLALVGKDKDQFAESLLRMQRDGLEYDYEDVQMYLWIMDRAPWMGVDLVLNLPLHLAHIPSSRLPEGQFHVLREMLSSDVRFQIALDSYRKKIKCPDEEFIHNYIRETDRPGTERPVTIEKIFSPRKAEPSINRPWQFQNYSSPFPFTRGINLFGYYKSPIGLGMLTTGLHKALEESGDHVQPNLLTNVAMDYDLRQAHCVSSFNYRLNTSIFISYPHLQESLLNRMPLSMVKGRRNIAYLAWEQRDGNPMWSEMYKGFDQIWALSDFAASCFRKYMQKPVFTIPAPIDFESFPPKNGKEAMGCDRDTFIFLFNFDANSSIERKNPEAVIDAFQAAVQGNEKVRLMLRIANSKRLQHQDRIEKIVQRVKGDKRIMVRQESLSHSNVLRLISACDCYVSLHHAEGFGYTCAEAMAYGIPVIATGYSGNLQFMDSECAYLVNYKEVELEHADGPFQRGSVWANPDISHAAALMREVFLNPDAARRRGIIGQRRIRKENSISAIAKLVKSALLECSSDVLPSRPFILEGLNT